jgi:SdrD B-like domain
MSTTHSSAGRNTQLAVRRKRAMSSVVVGVCFVFGSGFVRFIPGLSPGANASTLINGRAFIDLNGDGLQSPNAEVLYNEVGIPNATVTVTASSGASVVTKTNEIGDWVVNTDLPGPFRIQYTGLPAKLTDGSNRAGSLQFNNGGLSNLGAFGKVDGLGSIVDLTDVDLVGIGNRVWDDLNANGIQDAGEPGIPNVVITISSPTGSLRTASGCNGTTGDGVATTVTTDAQGLYQFVCLDPGKSFTLSIDKSQLAVGGPLAGYNATISVAGGDITLDSNGIDGGAAIIGSGVTINGFDMTYDFGFTKTGSGNTTTTAPMETTTTTWGPPTSAPTTTICDWSTTTVPVTTTTAVWDTTTTTVPATTSTTIPPTTTSTVVWDTTTTSVPTNTSTTTTLATTTTSAATSTTIPVTTTTGQVFTTTTIPATTTTIPVTATTVPKTTTTVPAVATTVAPAATTTTSTTTTTTFTFIFVPVTSTTTTLPAISTVIPTTTPTTTSAPVVTTTASVIAPTTSVKPVKVLGAEITPLPAPGETPAFTGSEVTSHGLQGVGLLLMGLGFAGLVRGRKDLHDC